MDRLPDDPFVQTSFPDLPLASAITDGSLLAAQLGRMDSLEELVRALHVVDRSDLERALMVLVIDQVRASTREAALDHGDADEGSAEFEQWLLGRR